MSNAAIHTSERPPDSDESRIRWVAGGTLGCVMAGHVLLETAGDVLFLANIEVERLPLLTIALAFLALGASRLSGERSHLSLLIALQGIAAAGTLGFWFLASAHLEWSFYALILWSGIITSLIVVRFWLVIGDFVTIGQGKRLFASIAMGGSMGALVGSGLAAMLAPSVGGRGLLVASAAAFTASMAGPTGFGRRRHLPEQVHMEEVPEAGNLRARLQDLLESPYACRVALLLVSGWMTLILGDYLFKSVLAEEIPADQLAIWLSRINLGLNVLSIAMLAVGVTPLIRLLGIDRAIVVLPILIALAGFGVLAGAALAATVFLKISDGTLRYSLHKTASELLYLPMTPTLRTSVKGAIDIVGQAGAKALGSLLVLGLVLLPDSRAAIAIAVVLFAGAWIAMALRLRQPYLDVFRQTLGDGAIETMIDHPELDLQSAGSLIRAISDPDERRSLAALQLLVDSGQCDLIPTLIVYHPAPRVVSKAIDVFAAEGREELSSLLPFLVEHEDANVRAASVRASWALDTDPEELEQLTESPCLAIRVSAYAGLLRDRRIEPERYLELFDEVLAQESPDPRLATATAARLSYHPVYREILMQLAGDDDLEVASEAVRAIRASDDAWFTSGLVDLLGDRRNREGVRAALMERGVSALAVLEDRLTDESTPIPILRHIPRTIARFDTPEAAKVLVSALPGMKSGMVRFKILHGLEKLLRRPGGVVNTRLYSRIDLAAVRTEFDRALRRSLELLRLEGSLAAGQQRDASLQTIGGELLVDLLRDKRTLSTGRLFMMLGLQYPHEDYRLIRAGLTSGDPTDRASAAELIETLLSPELARGILGLTLDGSVGALRAAEGRDPSGERRDYEEIVRLVLADASPSLRAIGLYHAGEVGISEQPITPRDSSPDGGAREAGEPHRQSAKDRGLAAVRDLVERNPRVAARLLVAR